METKTCGRCKTTKDKCCFRLVCDKRKTPPLTYHCSVCKECERLSALKKYNENKEKYQLQNKQYKSDNIDKINETRRKYMHIKMQDSSEKLKRNLKCLLCNKLSKKNSSKYYLGADFSLIKEWLEYNFDDYISWSNYGEYWHIDHTIPIKLFNLVDDTDVKTCFCWMNLMPLEKSKNLQKAGGLYINRVYLQEIKLRQFAKIKGLNIHEFLQNYTNKLRSILSVQHDQIAGTPLEPLLPPC